jgi:hypothetical protein
VDCRVTGCACGRSRVVKYVDAGAFTIVDTCTGVFVDTGACAERVVDTGTECVVDTDSRTKCVVDSVCDTLANTFLCAGNGTW